VARALGLWKESPRGTHTTASIHDREGFTRGICSKEGEPALFLCYLFSNVNKHFSNANRRWPKRLGCGRSRLGAHATAPSCCGLLAARPWCWRTGEFVLGFLRRYESYKKINRSHTHTHTHTHTQRENNTPTPTHTYTTRTTPQRVNPNEHLAQTLNSARRWRDDGACHLPRPGGWYESYE